jgi:hypothetical protein
MITPGVVELLGHHVKDVHTVESQMTGGEVLVIAERASRPVLLDSSFQV